jgi:tetratricopeptide (TPR) repeat protein
MYLYRGDYELADSCYQSADDINPAWIGIANYYRALILVYEGRLNESIIAFDNIDVIYSNANITTPEHVLRTKALAYREMGNFDAAVSIQERVVESYQERHPTNIINEQYFLAQFLAEKGDFKRAEEIAEALKNNISSVHSEQWAYWYARGTIELARGNSKAAVTALEEAAEIAQVFPVRYMLARAYLASDMPDKAITVLEREINIYNASWRLCLGPWSVKMHYWLGLAYEQVGRNKDAMAQLRTFVEKWHNADSNLVAYKDAKERLVRLTSNP